jgi:hypothetical protein
MIWISNLCKQILEAEKKKGKKHLGHLELLLKKFELLLK